MLNTTAGLVRLTGDLSISTSARHKTTELSLLDLTSAKLRNTIRAVDLWDPRAYPLWHGAAPMSSVLQTAGPQEMLVRGEGSWLIDRGERRLLDARAGSGMMTLGYGRDDIAAAMYRQALDLPFVCTARYERPAPVQVDLARALVDSAPETLTRVRFVHTGASAVEAALFMTRRYNRARGLPQKWRVIGHQGSYHGNTLMTMAAGGEVMLHDAFGPIPDGFTHLAPPDGVSCTVCLGDPNGSAVCVAGLESAIAELGADRVGAVIVEPIMGLRGMCLPTHYLRSVRELCSKHDILLIFDEVFSGFGRTGPMYASELSGVEPDMMCVSKGMTAGYAPLGAVLVNDRVFDVLNAPDQYFAHTSTSDGHPVCCAAGLATLQAYEREDVLARGQRLGDRLSVALADALANSQPVRAVRNFGSLIYINLRAPDGTPAAIPTLRAIQGAAEARGVLVDFTPYALLVVPPLNMSDEDADLVIETLATVIKSVPGATTMGTRL
jgi:adenosylmethionine-8-amino-7-oxononanoate aminotransferase